MDRLRSFLFLALFLLAPPAAAQQCGTVSNCPVVSTPLGGAEIMYIVQQGVSKKITVDQLGAGGVTLPITPAQGFFYTQGVAPPLILGPVANNVAGWNSSGNVAAIANTGTGDVVLQTSPTLINPTVGTQTTGNNSTLAASTAFVQNTINNIAPNQPILHQVGSNSITNGSGARGQGAVCDGGPSVHAGLWTDNNWCPTWDYLSQVSSDPSANVQYAPSAAASGTWSWTFTFGSGACVAGCTASYTATGADTTQTIATGVAKAIAGNANLYNNVSGAQGQILQVNDLAVNSEPSVNIDYNSTVSMQVTFTAPAGKSWTLNGGNACTPTCTTQLDVNPVLSLSREPAGHVGTTGDEIGSIEWQSFNASSANAFFGIQYMTVGSPTANAERGFWHMNTGAGGDELQFSNGLTTAGTTGGDQGKDTANFHAYYQDGVALPGTSGQFFATAFSSPASGAGCLLAYVVTTPIGVIECENFSTSTAEPFEFSASAVKIPSAGAGNVNFTSGQMLPDTTGSINIGSASLPFLTVYSDAFLVENNGSAAAAGAIGEVMQSGAPAATNATVTISIANPAVISDSAAGAYNSTGTNISIGSVINFTTSGALPTGLSVGTNYYVIATGFTPGTSYEISDTPGGSAIATSGTQSGTQTRNANAVMANNSPITVSALSLTSGEWNCAGMTATSNTSTTTSIESWIGPTSNSATGDIASSFVADQETFPVGAVSKYQTNGMTPIQVSSTTPYYLIAQTAFSAGTSAAKGALTCIRVR